MKYLQLAYAFTPQTQLPSMQESDLLAAHGHELLHFEPIEPDEHAELDSEQGLHEFTTLRLNAKTNAKKIDNLNDIFIL